MRLQNYGGVGKGYLTFENFKKFVDNTPYIKLIDLANNGEIFLNPDLEKIIKYAKEKQVQLEARGGVNFNTVSEDIMELMVKYKFKHLTIAIDGASPETYEAYRVNGKFDKVIDNIKRLNAIKKKFHSRYPKLLWQYVIMEENKHEIGLAKKFAKELNMRIKFKLDWNRKAKQALPLKEDNKPESIINKNNNSEPIPQKNVKAENKTINKEEKTKIYNRTDYEKKNKVPYKVSSCQQMVSSPQINWDGRLLGCCCNFKHDFGVNVFETGLENALKSDLYKKTMDILQGKIPDDGTTPCSNCRKYKFMKENN